MANYSLIQNGTQPFDPINLTPEKLETITYLARAYAKSDYVTDEEKKMLGFDIGSFILGAKINFYFADIRDFVWSYDFLYGNCFTFNKGFYFFNKILYVLDDIFTY